MCKLEIEKKVDEQDVIIKKHSLKLFKGLSQVIVLTQGWSIRQTKNLHFSKQTGFLITSYVIQCSKSSHSKAKKVSYEWNYV